MNEIRTGIGWDVHRLAWGYPLILGGVSIPGHWGLLGHSDADILSHAITDALLGAAALGDIGIHFPDSDPEWKGASSSGFLAKAALLARGLDRAGVRLVLGESFLDLLRRAEAHAA